MNGTVTLSGRYVLQEVVGTGGMSVVYRATDLKRRCDVAVKVLRRELMGDPAFVKRFEHEARAVSRLDHPNIISLMDVGQDGDVRYIVMEYVPGYTLKQFIAQRGRLAPNEAINITREILSAVSHAHKQHIIHRDLKPQNILLADDGMVKVSDFGIAQQKDSGNTINASEVLGSVHYISPEQARGFGISEQSDLYSVAVMLYEMVTGRVPFDGETPTAIAVKQIKEKPIPPRQFEASVSPALEEVILKGMEKDPRRRYQSANEMASDLLHAMRAPSGGFISGEHHETRKKRRPTKRMRTWMLIAITAVMVALLTLVGVLAVNRMRGGGSIPAPNVVNMTLDAAESELELNDLGSTVVEAYHEEIPKGVVISQSPVKGTAMEPGDRVILTVSKGVDMVMVPVVTGVSRSEAVRKLDELSIPIKEERLVVSNLETGTVVGQSPEAGNWISPSEGVTLEISGSSVDVPDVIDKPVDQATAELDALGLKVTARVYYPSSDGKADSVMNISPAVGTRVLRGSDVTLTLYAAPPDVYTNMVDVSFAVETDEPTITVRAVLIEPDGSEEEVYTGEAAPTSSMRLTLTLERATPGARELRVYVGDEQVASETVMFE
ncbi:MAG: protein kinase domain-containing protein [Candidatus Fimadaptatus sp.]|jgi:serine/threonine protein kinase